MANEDKFSLIKPYSDNSLTVYFFPFMNNTADLVKHLGISSDLLLVDNPS